MLLRIGFRPHPVNSPARSRGSFQFPVPRFQWPVLRLQIPELATGLWRLGTPFTAPSRARQFPDPTTGDNQRNAQDPTRRASARNSPCFQPHGCGSVVLCLSEVCKSLVRETDRTDQTDQTDLEDRVGSGDGSGICGIVGGEGECGHDNDPTFSRSRAGRPWLARFAAYVLLRGLS